MGKVINFTDRSIIQNCEHENFTVFKNNEISCNDCGSKMTSFEAALSFKKCIDKLKNEPKPKANNNLIYFYCAIIIGFLIGLAVSHG